MNDQEEVLRVPRGSDRMKSLYGKFSKIQGFIEKFERNLHEDGLKYLNPLPGEKILEIGFGRGRSLARIARAVRPEGKAFGIDLTPEMVKKARSHVKQQHLKEFVEIREGDARELPWDRNFFDAVYMASTLELFDNPDIPVVLDEIMRVLKDDGRLVIVSITKKDRESSFGIRAYEWFHNTFPELASCRPIYPEKMVRTAGFEVLKSEVVGNIIPMDVLLARPK